MEEYCFVAEILHYQAPSVYCTFCGNKYGTLFLEGKHFFYSSAILIASNFAYWRPNSSW